MRKARVVLILPLVLLSFSSSAISRLQSELQSKYNVTLVASGFSWVENLLFHEGFLWATDLRRGNIWRFAIEATSNKSRSDMQFNRIDNIKYSQMLWNNGWDRVLGLAADPRRLSDGFYVVGALNGTNVLAAVNSSISTLPSERANMRVLAKLPALGNGLGVHQATGLVYTSSEGDFLPRSGFLFEVDPATGRVTTLAGDLFAADGLWIDQVRHLLYVSQLFSGDVIVWNLTSLPPKRLGVLEGLQTGSFLDDFTLSEDGRSIIGCDWSASEIVKFPSWPFAASKTCGRGIRHATPIVSTSIKHPTSARFGVGAFGARSLYVSEGDSLFASSHSDKIWRIDF